jgi:hypothetical protein
MIDVQIALQHGRFTMHDVQIALRDLSTIPMRLRLVLSVFLAVTAACGSVTRPNGFARPEDASIVTTDVAAFWTAFDQIKSSVDTAPLRGYIDNGTVGLKDFTDLRWKNSKTLTQMVWAQRSYYASIRGNTLTAAQMEPQIRAAFAIADTLIDDAIFPDVFFAIGGMGTGGTTSDHGLLIGVELFSKAPDSPTDALTPWQKSVIRSTDILPAIVAHELVHYQQRYGGGNTLLGQAIREGSADFIGKLLSGRTINESIEAYGLAHEAELWAEFKQDMNGSDVSRWLYNGGTVTATSTRPADLGYFMGARIAESYYRKATDKHAALQQILRITNFQAFLAASGYEGR